MKKLVCLIVLGLSLSTLPGFAITPEAARKELAQENIPYTAEAMISHIENGDSCRCQERIRRVRADAGR